MWHLRLIITLNTLARCVRTLVAKPERVSIHGESVTSAHTLDYCHTVYTVDTVWYFLFCTPNGSTSHLRRQRNDKKHLPRFFFFFSSFNGGWHPVYRFITATFCSGVDQTVELYGRIPPLILSLSKPEPEPEPSLFQSLTLPLNPWYSCLSWNNSDSLPKVPSYHPFHYLAHIWPSADDIHSAFNVNMRLLALTQNPPWCYITATGGQIEVLQVDTGQ